MTAMLGGCGRADRPPTADGGTLKWAELYSVESGPAAQANQEWLAGIIAQFGEENPGWSVELEGFQWDEIDQRMIVDHQAEVPHDLVFTSPQLMAQHAQAGSLLDVSRYLQDWDTNELEDLNWSPVWQSATVGGEQLGVPLGVHTRANFYNRQLFQDASLDPDTPLTSPDEVLDAAKQLTNPDEGVWGLGLYLGPSRATVELSYAPMVWHFGGDFFDDESGQAILTSDASLQAVQWLFDLVHTHEVSPPFAFAGDADYGSLVLNNSLEGRNAQAMGFGSYWITPLEDAGMIQGCFPPSENCIANTGGVMVQPSDARAQFANAWCLSLHQLSEHPEMAMALMEVALRPDNLASFPDAGLPARRTTWSEPQYQTDFYQTWFEAAEQGRPMPATPHFPELADTVASAIQEVLTRKSDVEATMERFENEWNSRYA